MKVLVLWPPHVPSYFNAGHHLTVFLIASYLRTLPDIELVEAIDAGALNYTWKELGDLLYQGQHDVLVICNDFDNVDDLDRLIRYARQLVPDIKIVTGGRLSSQAPKPFRQHDFDAVVEHGDLEAGVATYLRWLSGTDNPNHPGVAVRTKTGWQEGGLGLFLPPEQWQLPDVKEIPYSDYGRMYRRDQNKFCGIPERRELVVPAARGCPINCAFCEVSTFQGRRDRRLTVERTVKYIEDSFTAHPFEYVAFYAPTFTLDRRWIVRLCDQLIDRNAPYPWKCATAIAYLDDELLALMAQSGCIRVSVGLETLDPDGHGALPRRKRIELDRFHHLAEQCRALEIELNCFVIVGLPGTTIEGTGRTIQEIRDVGGRVRPTIYSSMASLRAAETLEQAAEFNRHLIPSAKSHDSSEVHLCYGFLFGREDWTTPVMSRIPEHAGRLE